MNLSEQDIEHNRQIDEAQEWLEKARRFYESKFGSMYGVTDMEVDRTYQKYLKELEIRVKEAKKLYDQNKKIIKKKNAKKRINPI